MTSDPLTSSPLSGPVDETHASAIGGDLPSGKRFDALVVSDTIVLRVDDLICAVHARWMTPAEAIDLGRLLVKIAGGVS